MRREEAGWAQSKKEWRDRRHKELWRMAYPDDSRRTISVEDLKKIVESGRL